MKIPIKVQHGLVVLGIVVLGYILLVPKNKKSKNNSPKIAEDSKVKNLQNAKVVLDAYLNAVEAKETPQALNKLNSIFAQEYQLKVQKNAQGKYVARTLSGEDVLMVK
jgi:hypothetical protein